MTITDEAALAETAKGRDALVEEIFGAVLGAQAVQAAYIGDRLGWYRSLAEGTRTSVALAADTTTDERYAREWLEHQTVSGYVACTNPEAPAAEREYFLPPGHAEVLTDETSLAYVLPLARLAMGLGKQVDAVLDAYRTGGGVSWETFGEDAREAQAASNRPMFTRQLGHEYLASIPDIDAKLRAGGRVADIGAGYAWSSIGVAGAYPNATVDAFDVDAASVEMAKRNIAESGLADRVRARHVDAGTLPDGDTFDLVMALECIHDMPDPVSVLATMRRLAGEDGIVIVMDERVGERFTGESDEVERLMYGFSLTCCLLDGKAHERSVETGTVMRPSTFEGYARSAGFEGVEILPIENDFFRFYRLV